MPIARPYPDEEIFRRGPQRTFTGGQLDQVAFPLGGIGAGTVFLGGSGQLKDLSILHKPNLGVEHFAFAAIHAAQGKGRTDTRVIEGPVTSERIFDGGRIFSGGHFSGTEGLPRFRRASFRGEFPFAFMEFSDPKMPLKVSLRAWSPFIPLDDRASGMPLACLEYTFKNSGRRRVQAVFSWSMRPPVQPCKASEKRPATDVDVRARKEKGLRGFCFDSTAPSLDIAEAGTFVVASDDPEAASNCLWFRGGWFDPVTMLWRDLEAGRVARRAARPADPEGHYTRSLGGTLAVPFDLAPGDSRTVRLALAWHYPNNPLRSGQSKESACSCQGEACAPSALADAARPWYATQWQDAWDVARDFLRHRGELASRTEAFRAALFSSTLPEPVLDAVSANLGILRSPTVLRQKDGTVWAWEGCNPSSGCCPGSCTHVWTYAQSMPHLFPALERTMRQDEYDHAMDASGHVKFRFSFPQGPAEHALHAAADGQLGGVMKVYREWMIGGDDAWLRLYYPKARAALEYCTATWDPDREGWLREPHHNTYDIEFWGPNGMCTSFYLGALRAVAAMGRHLGEDVQAFEDLADRGLRRVNEELWDGECYIQKVQWKGLRADPFQYAGIVHWTPHSPEALALMRKEGPKYQYGPGCLADGVLGQWHTTLYGLPDALDRRRTRRHLRNVFRHNFRASLHDHVNPQRSIYALNDEAGLLLCTWPRGGAPTLPFVYSNEVWTGIEYHVAAHCIFEGLVREGLTIVKAARDRHEGAVRNPWNEYECGSFYARAMSSYALLGALSGFRYDAPFQRLTLAPRLPDKRFACFFSTASGWGTVHIDRSKPGKTVLRVEMSEGELSVREVILDGVTVAEWPEASVARVGKPVTVAVVD